MNQDIFGQITITYLFNNIDYGNILLMFNDNNGLKFVMSF